MAFVVKDRVKETTLTTGTGTITLAGAVIGYQTFSAIGDGNNTFYTIAGQATSEWEVGIGTYTASGTTLSRDTILASSNSGSAVNFSAGTKDVFVTYPAGKAIFQNNLDSVVVAANTSSDALRITQTGSGNALLVEDDTNPDATPFVVDNIGNVGIGGLPNSTTTSLTAWTDTAAWTNIVVGKSNNGNNSTNINLYKSRGTRAAPLIVNVDDNIGNFGFLGYDGTSYINAAAIRAAVDGTPGTNDMPGRLLFFTTADGASSATERMRIDSAGNVGIGGAATAGNTLVSYKAMTGGGGYVYAFNNVATVNSDATVEAVSFQSFLSTQAASFTAANLRHFKAYQSTIGAGSTVTNQVGYFADASLTGATNNYGFYSDIASGTGRYNFYANGTATNYFGGNTIISVADNTNAALRITQTGTGNAILVEDEANPDSSPFVVNADGRVAIGNTTALPAGAGLIAKLGIANGTLGVSRYANDSSPSVVDLARSRNTTIGSQTIVQSGDGLGVFYFSGSDGTGLIRAASILAEVDGTPGTNDMPGRLIFSTTADGASSPTERMRIDSSGNVGIGGTTIAGFKVSNYGNLSGAVTAYSYYAGSTFQSDVTTNGIGFGTFLGTQAASFTLTSLTHFRTAQGTFGAGSTVTNQFGFEATNTLTGATNNYGFYSDIASGTGRWNFYAAGTASNYFAGTTLIGTTTNTNTSTLVVNGTISQTVSSTQYLVVDQSDIGTAANEIPLNQYLGANAYVDTETPALNVGTGITTGTGTICRANGGLSGGIYRMTILINLTGLNSGGTAGDIIGVNGTALPCYIAQLPAMTVLGGRMTCLETPAGGDTDIDLYSATAGTGVEDQAISALTGTEIINAGVQSRGTVTYFTAYPATNTYFYLVGQGVANATYTAGRFLIEIFGVQ